MHSFSRTIENASPATAGSKDWTALLGRIGLALIFVLTGLTMLTAIDGTIAYISSVPPPFPPIALAAAVAVEIGGGVALIF